MERHFDHDLEELKQRLLWMGSLAERAVHQAVHAVLDAEEHLAEVVLSEEDAINEMQIEIDERVQRLLATQQPMAADLRFLLAVSRLNALVRGDQELAQSVLRRDDQVDRLRDQLFRELLTYMMEDSAQVFAAFELILVAKNLERIGDHATNIAEDVIYFVAGRDVRHPALDRR